MVLAIESVDVIFKCDDLNECNWTVRFCVQFGKLYRVVQILSLSGLTMTVALLFIKKSGSNFRVCVKFQNVAIKFKFTEIEKWKRF